MNNSLLVQVPACISLVL